MDFESGLPRPRTERLEGPTRRGGVLIEPARSADDTGHLLQFGLTMRETQVAHAVLGA